MAHRHHHLLSRSAQMPGAPGARVPARPSSAATASAVDVRQKVATPWCALHWPLVFREKQDSLVRRSHLS